MGGTRRLPTTAAIMAAVFLCAAGCSDEGPSGPGAVSTHTLETIWPLHEGNTWVYAVSDEVRDAGWPMYASLDVLPDIPPLEDLYAELQGEGPGDVFASGTATLTNTLANERSLGGDDVFDVQSELRHDDPGYFTTPPLPVWLATTLIRSGTRLATYHEFGTGWVFADGPLTVGHVFTVPLDTSGEQLELTTWVRSVKDIEVGGTTYRRCLECVFVLDAGVLSGTGPGGEPTGVARSFGWGVVLYAPEVGPVHSRSRFLGGPDVTLESRADLVSFEPGAG